MSFVPSRKAIFIEDEEQDNVEVDGEPELEVMDVDERRTAL